MMREGRPRHSDTACVCVCERTEGAVWGDIIPAGFTCGLLDSSANLRPEV